MVKTKQNKKNYFGPVMEPTVFFRRLRNRHQATALGCDSTARPIGSFRPMPMTVSNVWVAAWGGLSGSGHGSHTGDLKSSGLAKGKENLGGNLPSQKGSSLLDSQTSVAGSFKRAHRTMLQHDRPLQSRINYKTNKNIPRKIRDQLPNKKLTKSHTTG